MTSTWQHWRENRRIKRKEAPKMAKKFRDLAEAIRSDPKRAARVEEIKRGIRDALALSELRADQGVTQTDLARVLGVSQTNISRIEHENDVYVSTLRSYVEALGGRLELRAVFSDRDVGIDVSNFFFNDTATTEIYTLSLHDALPI